MVKVQILNIGNTAKFLMTGMSKPLQNVTTTLIKVSFQSQVGL